MGDKKKNKEEKLKEEKIKGDKKQNSEAAEGDTIVSLPQTETLTDAATENTAVIEFEETSGKKKKGKKEKKEKKPLDRAAKKKRKKIIMFSILGVAVVLFVVTRMFGKQDAGVFVATTGAITGEIEQTLSTSGTVTTEKTKSYFSDVDVQISQVSVEAGDAVKAGDVLISYDEGALAREKELAQLKVKSAEGNYKNSVQNNSQKIGDLNEANVNLEVLDQQIADTEAYITNLNYKIDKKKSDLAYEGALLQISLLDWQDQPDSDEYMNLQKLVQLNSYEQQNNKEIQGWEDELEVYNKMLSDYKEYRSEMKSQLSSAESSKMTSGAKEELEAEKQTKEIEVADSLESLEAVENGVTAEFDGVVTEINAVEGGSVAAGSQLLKLESTQDVMVKISVTKYDLDKIAVGQKAVITIGGKEYQGTVSKINKMAEKNNSGAAVVGTEIKITNPDSDVILGVEAKVIVSTAKAENAVLVPVTAVNVDMDGEFVYAVEENILVKKPIVTGISSDTMVQVTEGLEEGAQVVTDVTANLQEGMSVMAMPQ